MSADYMESGAIVGGGIFLDVETASHEFSIDVAEAPNHLERAVVLGDFLHNVRSALDHLVWQLVLLENACAPSPQNQFPIALTEAAYLGRDGRSGMRKRMLAGVGADQLAIIDRVQPYRLGELASTHSLASLQWRGCPVRRGSWRRSQTDVQAVVSVADGSVAVAVGVGGRRVARSCSTALARLARSA